MHSHQPSVYWERQAFGQLRNTGLKGLGEKTNAFQSRPWRGSLDPPGCGHHLYLSGSASKRAHRPIKRAVFEQGSDNTHCGGTIKAG